MKTTITLGKRRRVTLDGTPLLDPRTSIGRLTGSLLQAMLLKASANGIDLRLVARAASGPSIRELYPRLPTTHLRVGPRADGVIRALGVVELMAKGDVYHATDLWLPVRRSERTVVTVHDLDFLTTPTAPGAPAASTSSVRLDPAARAELERRERLPRLVPPLLRSAGAIIAVSEYVKRQLVERLQLAPERIHVIPWGIDRVVYAAAPSRVLAHDDLGATVGLTRPYFFAVDCGDDRRNTPRLLAAYRRLLADRPTHDLVLAWTPPANIAAEYAAEAASGRIHFLKGVGDESRRRLMLCAAALVHPALDEPFGLPVLEAFASGVPCIAADHGALPEVGGTAAILVDAGDVDSLYASLVSIEKGQVDRDARRMAGFTQVARFNWTATAAATLDVYRQFAVD